MSDPSTNAQASVPVPGPAGGGPAGCAVPDEGTRPARKIVLGVFIVLLVVGLALLIAFFDAARSLVRPAHGHPARRTGPVLQLLVRFWLGPRRGDADQRSRHRGLYRGPQGQLPYQGMLAHRAPRLGWHAVHLVPAPSPRGADPGCHAGAHPRSPPETHRSEEGSGGQSPLVGRPVLTLRSCECRHRDCLHAGRR